MNDDDKLRRLLAPLVDFAQSSPQNNDQPQPTNPPPSPNNQAKTEHKESKKKIT